MLVDVLVLMFLLGGGTLIAISTIHLLVAVINFGGRFLEKSERSVRHLPRRILVAPVLDRLKTSRISFSPSFVASYSFEDIDKTRRRMTGYVAGLQPIRDCIISNSSD